MVHLLLMAHVVYLLRLHVAAVLFHQMVVVLMRARLRRHSMTRSHFCLVMVRFVDTFQRWSLPMDSPGSATVQVHVVTVRFRLGTMLSGGCAIAWWRVIGVECR